MRYLYPNLDFEYEWSSPQPHHYRPAPHFQRLFLRWHGILRVLPGCRDAELLPVCPAEDFVLSPQDELVPWGWTPRMLRWSPHAPASSFLHQLARWNGKDWSHKLEQELGCASPASQLVTNFGELEQAIKTCPVPWVAKHPFGVSGRERILGPIGHIPPNAANWAKRQFRKSVTLVFEPWLANKRETSFHYNIHPNASFEWLGHCTLLTDTAGTHRGNAYVPKAAPPNYRRVLDQVVSRLASEGYVGPVSFDCLEGEFGSEWIERPLVEMNVRITFGRLTLALRAHLPAGCAFAWLHPKARDAVQIQGHFQPIPLPENASVGLFLLPTWATPHDPSSSFLVLAENAEALKDSLQQVEHLCSSS